MNKEMVILVDEYDNPLGLMEKIRAHEKGFFIEPFQFF